MSRVIAFDFDNTLTVEEWGKPTGWNERMLRRMRLHAYEGDVIIIVTARHGQEADERLSALGWERVGAYPLVYASVARRRLPVGAVFFTDGALKGPFLSRARSRGLVRRQPGTETQCRRTRDRSDCPPLPVSAFRRKKYPINKCSSVHELTPSL